MNGHATRPASVAEWPQETHKPHAPVYPGLAIATGPSSASRLADETTTLALVVAGLRALRVELHRCAGIDALRTPASYRAATEDFDALLGDLAGMLDTREWADVDRRRAA